MADRKVDYDRGAIIMSHPGSGMDVFMYADSPGKYFDAHLNTVPEKLAQEAGYNIEQFSKERVRMERKAQASAIIDQELADDNDIEETVVKKRNGFSVVSIGLGRHNVRDPDGNILNVHPMPKESAVKLFSVMAGEEVKAVEQSK